MSTTVISEKDWHVDGQQDSFARWRRKLDQRITLALGVGLDDCPDQSTADWYSDGLTVEDALGLWAEAMQEETGDDMFEELFG